MSQKKNYSEKPGQLCDGEIKISRKSCEETIQEFHTLLREVRELSLGHEADSQLMERSSPTKTWIGVVGDVTTTSQVTSTNPAEDLGEG